MLLSFGLPWRSCAQSCTILGPSWGDLAPYWGQCEAILGPSWAILESSWAILGLILEIIGLILAMFGSILAQLEFQTRTCSKLLLFTKFWPETVLWICWQVLAYASICWQVLAYAGKCWHTLGGPAEWFVALRLRQKSEEFDRI